MSEQLPPDWAINKAIQLSGTDTRPVYLKNHPDLYRDLRAFARYIAEHEEEPVDQLYEALKAVVGMGRYDTREQVDLLRAELAERGLEVSEIGRGDA